MLVGSDTIQGTLREPFNLPSPLVAAPIGTLHEDRVLNTVIDDVVLHSGGPEVC
jgi:hypothetical protein